jgi:hypothetical protein
MQRTKIVTNNSIMCLVLGLMNKFKNQRLCYSYKNKQQRAKCQYADNVFLITPYPVFLICQRGVNVFFVQHRVGIVGA